MYLDLGGAQTCYELPWVALAYVPEAVSPVKCHQTPYSTCFLVLNPLAPTDFSHQMLKIDLESLTDDCESYSTNEEKKIAGNHSLVEAVRNTRATPS
jgi:hypothetical protein